MRGLGVVNDWLAPRRRASPQIPMSLRLATVDENARTALDCGSSSYRFPPSIHTANVQGAAEEER
jgi:hypothetical protein